jgi:hypothetical protein
MEGRGMIKGEIKRRKKERTNIENKKIKGRKRKRRGKQLGNLEIGEAVLIPSIRDENEKTPTLQDSTNK